MANALPLHVRVIIVSALIEGTSIRATARQTHTNKDAVMRLAKLVGLGCMKLHNKFVQKVHVGFLEVDEAWAYVGVHEKRRGGLHPRWYGDVYTFFGIDAETKLVPSYVTAKRTLSTATKLMTDLRARLTGRPQISVDGWPCWPDAVRRGFGFNGAHVASTVKEYQKEGKRQAGAGSYGRVKSQKRTVIMGKPDQDFISTSIAERLNLTTRMHQRRLTRLTNAFSKNITNLRAAVGLHFFHYNFVRPHETLDGGTPAVSAGLADHAWTIREMILAALDELGMGVKPPVRPKRYKRKTHTLMEVP